MSDLEKKLSNESRHKLDRMRQDLRSATPEERLAYFEECDLTFKGLVARCCFLIERMTVEERIAQFDWEDDTFCRDCAEPRHEDPEDCPALDDDEDDDEEGDEESETDLDLDDEDEDEDEDENEEGERKP